MTPSHTYALPLRFGPRGYLGAATGTRSTLACIGTILDTLPGEIEMEPAFGSRLPLLLHEPNDAALAQEMLHETRDAVARNERRVVVERAVFSRDRGPRTTDADLTLRPRGARMASQETLALTPRTR